MFGMFGNVWNVLEMFFVFVVLGFVWKSLEFLENNTVFCFFVGGGWGQGIVDQGKLGFGSIFPLHLMSRTFSYLQLVSRTFGAADVSLTRENWVSGAFFRCY